MAQASARYLPHFHTDGDGRLRPSDAARGTARPAEPSLAEMLAGAEAKGRRLAEEAAVAAMEQRLAAEREAFAAELAAARRQWSGETADRLAASLAAELDALRETVLARTARALVPFLGDLVRERALGELAATVRALLRDGRHVHARIAGPADLLDALRHRLDVPSVEYVPADSPDVAVTIDDTAVETRIAAWTGLVAAALAGNADG